MLQSLPTTNRVRDLLGGGSSHEVGDAPRQEDRLPVEAILCVVDTSASMKDRSFAKSDKRDPVEEAWDKEIEDGWDFGEPCSYLNRFGQADVLDKFLDRFKKRAYFQDLKQVIEKTVAGGETVATAAAKAELAEKLLQEICRLDRVNPGADEDDRKYFTRHKEDFVGLLIGRPRQRSSSAPAGAGQSGEGSSSSGGDAEEDSSDDAPPHFMCPITYVDYMVDPVVLADGFSYERAAAEEWLRERNTSPYTGAKLAHKNIVPNHNLKSEINEWRERNGLLPSASSSANSSASSTSANSLSGEGGLDDLNSPLNTLGTTTSAGRPPSNVLLLELSGDAVSMAKYGGVFGGSNPTLEVVCHEDLALADVLVKAWCQMLHQKTNTKYFLSSARPSNLALWYFEDPAASVLEDGKNMRYGSRFDLQDEPSLSKSLAKTLRRTPGCIIADPYYGNFPRVRLEAMPRRCRRKEERNLRRIDVVKQLFEAFLNRSAAYNYATAIGLMPFNTTVPGSDEIEITGSYEKFRERLKNIKAEGETRLYDALAGAGNALAAWRAKLLEVGRAKQTAEKQQTCLGGGS